MLFSCLSYALSDAFLSCLYMMPFSSFRFENNSIHYLMHFSRFIGCLSLAFLIQYFFYGNKKSIPMLKIYLSNPETKTQKPKPRNPHNQHVKKRHQNRTRIF